MDEWLNSIRETLENSDSDMEAMDQFKLDLYKDEVFVFTPKGDLYKLPQGATVLDFAFLSTPTWDAGVRVPASTGKCTAPPETEQWRPGGNHDFEYADTEA